MNERFQQRRAEFDKALQRLTMALAQERNEYTQDAVIQRFEFTYELAWKALKNLLAMKDIDVRNAKDTLKAAYQQGLIQDANAWSLLHQQRNLTSHTYDSQLADEVYDFVAQQGVTLFKALQTTLAAL